VDHRVRTNADYPKAEWEIALEMEETGEDSGSWFAPLPEKRYDGFGYRWRRFRYSLFWIRYGFRMAVKKHPAWVGAREVKK
jgi:hypothetical protein